MVERHGLPYYGTRHRACDKAFDTACLTTTQGTRHATGPRAPEPTGQGTRHRARHTTQSPKGIEAQRRRAPGHSTGHKARHRAFDRAPRHATEPRGTRACPLSTHEPRSLRGKACEPTPLMTRQGLSRFDTPVLCFLKPR
nr:MAG TPA: hypothetical protein [Caudoviricetes sp.]